MDSDVFVIQWDLGINGMGKIEFQIRLNAMYIAVSGQMGSNCNAFSVRYCDENLMCSLCIERGTWSGFIWWGIGVFCLCVQLPFCARVACWISS